jgi:RNA polymerase sigma factor (sigma-70 family)
MQPPDLTKLKKGDPSEWSVAFDWLWPSAKSKALYTGMNRCCTDDAEDVASAALSVLSRKVKDGLIRQVDELKALLLRIVHDKAIDHCRELLAQKRGGGVTTSLEAMQEGEKGAHEPASNDTPLAKLEISDLGALIRKAGNQLKNKEWSMLEDFFFSELTYKEISEKHGLAVGSVGVYIKRATEKLRPLLKEHQISM